MALSWRSHQETLSIGKVTAVLELATRGMHPFTRSEWLLTAGTTLLCLAALLVPALAQDQAYHHFADARRLLGVPRAMDVLSNAGFVLLGLCGLALMATRRMTFFSSVLKASALAFFAGFVLTGFGSAYYHLAPDDPRLAWDRLGMVVAFAGVLGLVTTQRVSDRAGVAMLGLTLLAGPGSIAWWLMQDSVSPYAVLQFGGMLTAALCLLGRPRGVGPNWVFLLVAYTLAKVTEGLDGQIFAWTGELVSGHTLKHLLAALPAWAIIQPLLTARPATRDSTESRP